MSIEHIASLVVISLMVIVPMAILATPFYLIWTTHRRKMEELRLQRHQMLAGEIRAEFNAVRAEIQQLRDTTLQYDLSFDNALQQVDSRLSLLESRARSQTVESAPQNVTLGGRG